MGFITRYGSFWGLVPQTSGRIFWVAPSATYTVEGRSYSASDNADGLSPERAVLTLDYAIGLTTANVGDVIIMLPGAHSYSATVAVDVAGITITGIPASNAQHRSSSMPSTGRRRSATVVNTGTAGIILTVTAADVEIGYLTFLPVAAGGVGISASNLADRLFVHDCIFALVATAAVTTYGIYHGVDLTDALEDVTVSNCYFQSGLSTSSGANGGGVCLAGTVAAFSIENSTFELKGNAAWAVAVLSSNAGSTGLVIRDVDFINPVNTTTVITTAVTTSAQTIDGSTLISRCYVSAGTDVATASAIVDIVLVETYLASSGGGALANNN